MLNSMLGLMRVELTGYKIALLRALTCRNSTLLDFYNTWQSQATLVAKWQLSFIWYCQKYIEMQPFPTKMRISIVTLIYVQNVCKSAHLRSAKARRIGRVLPT